MRYASASSASASASGGSVAARAAASTRLARRGAAALRRSRSSISSKCGGDAGLEREAPQQRLAEGMDGLDAECRRARRARARKAGARDRASRHRARSPVSSTSPRPGRRRRRRPAAQPWLMRFAISAAAALVKVRQRMRARRRAGQQQAQHAVGQHIGLAGAGRSVDPDRGAARSRGAALRDDRRRSRARCRNSSASPPATIPRPAPGDRNRRIARREFGPRHARDRASPDRRNASTSRSARLQRVAMVGQHRACRRRACISPAGRRRSAAR